MKNEIKVSLICVGFCCIFMIVFGYFSSVSEHSYYVYQVGTYKDEINKDAKITELKQKGYDGFYYMKNNQYYVLSFISDDKDEVEKHSAKLKGIIKEYKFSSVMNDEEILKALEKGEAYD